MTGTVGLSKYVYIKNKTNQTNQQNHPSPLSINCFLGSVGTQDLSLLGFLSTCCPSLAQIHPCDDKCWHLVEVLSWAQAPTDRNTIFFPIAKVWCNSFPHTCSWVLACSLFASYIYTHMQTQTCWFKFHVNSAWGCGRIQQIFLQRYFHFYLVSFKNIHVLLKARVL